MSSIEIIRDIDGIAHVRAASMLDAFVGQGLAAAQDRLWQFTFDRNRALGRLAEIVGPSGVASDAFHRRMGIGAFARASHDALGDEARSVLDAYARGVNRHIVEDKTDLPPEFGLLGFAPEPWEGWHSIAVYLVRHLAMGTFETKVWRSGLVASHGAADAARLWPSVEETTIDPDGAVVAMAADVAHAMAGAAQALASIGGDDALGSNNLAIDGSRTSTGRPIVAGDPHRAIDLPNVYWQNQVSCPDFDVIGLSFPGVPGFPHFGHNADVAWCITHAMADDQDVFVERLRRVGAKVESLVDGEWRPASVRTESIAVAGHADVEIRCLETEHGPVVAGDEAIGLALRWTAMAAPDTTADALVPMLRAGSVDEMDRALVSWVVPVNNLLMADRDGAIAYRMRGRLATRSRDNGWTAVPGDDPGHDWTGFVADGDLARWRDPACGFLVTANNRISPSGPYVSHDWAHPARAARLTALVGSGDDWDVESVAELLGDTHSAVAAAFSARLTTCRPSHPAEVAALRLLHDWDHHLDADSAAGALYGTVRAELIRIVVHDLGLADDRLPGVPGPSLHQTMRFVNARLAFWIADPSLVGDVAVATALRIAVAELVRLQGTDPTRWRWGATHTAGFVHPLAVLRPDLADRLPVPPPIELGGDTECVWATSTAPPSTVACNGPVARYVFDVGDWDRSVWIVPHGVSGDPRSAHHTDQLDDWAALRVRPMRYSTGAVDAATRSIQHVDPSSTPRGVRPPADRGGTGAPPGVSRPSPPSGAR